MITLRLFGNETDANHFREEGRHLDLDRRGCVHNRRYEISIRERAKRLGCPFPSDRDAWKKAGILDRLWRWY